LTGYFLVLTSSAGVPEDWVQKAALATGGGPRRLGPGAVEIGVLDPSALDAAREELFDADVDINVVPAASRRKKLLIADMDSTIIPIECIDELADFAGLKERVAEITERAMRGELDFETALRERVGMLAGLPESALEAAYRDRVSLNPGAAALVGTMNRAGAMTALVSGGFTFFTGRVAAAAGFRYNQANTLIFADGKLTGEVAAPILGRAAKLEALEWLCAEAGIALADAVWASPITPSRRWRRGRMRRCAIRTCARCCISRATRTRISWNSALRA
jgi:phosphoserine phosphatase